MLKFRWLLLSCLSVLLFSSPAEAGKLLFWRFESTQNRLVFSTDDRVQPKAVLIPNPTRLVIDLPGTTLERPTVNQPLGGAFVGVRVGQFDSQTARLVVELAPGYTLDPQQITFRGISPTQWLVNLPQPQRLTAQPIAPSPPTRPPITVAPPIAPPTPRPSEPSVPTLLQVTRNGLVVKIEGDRNNKITRRRSRDRRRIEFDLQGITLPEELVGQTLNANSYGVSQITFEQRSTSPPVARLTLAVEADGPDWEAAFSRLGGLVLFPEGGVSAADRASTVPRFLGSAHTQPAAIATAQLSRDNTQLLIVADRDVQAQGRWNPGEGTYEVTLANAVLGDSFRGPQLQANSPITRLRVRQQDSQTVVLILQPTLGTRVEGVLSQGGEVAVQFRSTQAPATVDRTSLPSQGIVLFVPPPESGGVPPVADVPGSELPRVPNSRALVVIDPGHGGKDPGTIGIGGLQEKNIVLPISLQVKELLERQGIAVKMTRGSDYFVTLGGRTDLANSIDADLFVSIHANAINLSRPDINGLETYYYQNGRELAQVIHQSILRSVNIRDRRVRQARFYVLRTANMPSVLVEVGFVTGREDAPNLQNPGFQRQMAEAISRGILEFIQRKRL